MSFKLKFRRPSLGAMTRPTLITAMLLASTAWSQADVVIGASLDGGPITVLATTGNGAQQGFSDIVGGLFFVNASGFQFINGVGGALLDANNISISGGQSH